MMRWSGLGGFCILLAASQAIVACGDDSNGGTTTGGSSSQGGSSGAAGKTSGGDGVTAGTSTTAGTGGSGDAAGADTGGAPTAGTGGTAGSGGSAGTGGTGVVPNCTTDQQCDDTNPCTDDACTNGDCAHTNNTKACDDGNLCTSDDACAAGACKGTNNTVACDDLSSCTTDDKCAGGVCLGTKDLVACPSCADASNMILNCDFADGMNHWLEGWFGGGGTQQVVNERLVVDVTAGGTNVFDVQPRQEMLSLKHGMKYKLRLVAGASVDRKIVVGLTQAVAPYKVHSTGDSDAGGFVLNLTKQMKPFEFEFVMADPDDSMVKLELKLGGLEGNPSTVYFDDAYVAEEKCDGAAFCDDGNACTDDACDVGTGICSWTNTTAACTDDNNACTTDVCAAGACTHAPLADDAPCTDDADACTSDVCTAGACTHAFDANVCACQQDQQCDDQNPCTDDKCNAGACENTNNTAACDDKNACTSSDVCAAGVCGGTDNTAACDDGDACTVTDACDTGACKPGTNVCFDCNVAGNLLTNCDLSAGDTGWLPGFFGGTGTQSVTGGRLVVDITNGGTDGYMVQPRQEGLVLMQGTTYVVRFNALASVARGMAMSITQNGGGYVSYSGEQTFALTTQMQAFQFEFTMNDAPPVEKAKFELRLGGTANNPAANTVTLDNLSIAPKP